MSNEVMNRVELTRREEREVLKRRLLEAVERLRKSAEWLFSGGESKVLIPQLARQADQVTIVAHNYGAWAEAMDECAGLKEESDG